MLALDRARVGPSFGPRADRVPYNQTESSKFADKPSNSTQLKQIQLDSLSLGHYVGPTLGPTECQH